MNSGARFNSLPVQAGVGLRAPYYSDFADGLPATGFLEIHPENYFGGGARLAYLELANQHYPLSFHCVGLSLGSTEIPKPQHLQSLKRLTDQFTPALISDHLSWSASGNAHLNDLLPLPYTRESLQFLARNIDHVQQTLGRAIAIENPSLYLSFKNNSFSETEFLNELALKTNCHILLDINNIYVNQCNNGVDARHYLDTISANAVAEIHLAGHSVEADATQKLHIDTHDHPVCDSVWNLYEYALQKIGRRPTLIEWDAQFPPLHVLLNEAHKADILLNAAKSQDQSNAGGFHAAA